MRGNHVVFFESSMLWVFNPNYLAGVGSRGVVKMVYKKCELCAVYPTGAGSDCVLFGFPKDMRLKEKCGVATKLNMEKVGFLCQKHFRASDVVFRKQSRLLHGTVASEVSSEDASVKIVGVVSVEVRQKVGKREGERTEAREKVVKKLAEKNDVRMLKMKMRTENEAVKNQTEYVKSKVRMLETKQTEELRRIEECEKKVVGLLMASGIDERLHEAEVLRKAGKAERRKKASAKTKVCYISPTSEPSWSSLEI